MGLGFKLVLCPGTWVVQTKISQECMSTSENSYPGYIKRLNEEVNSEASCKCGMSHPKC